MLSLMDPVELERLVVFRDDEDPRKFYLLPDQPVIPLDDEGNLEFLFIKYIKDLDSISEEESIGGGWLQFRSVLNIDEQRRERVIDGLRTQLQQEKTAGKKPFNITITTTEPILATPVWKDGKVTLSTFKVSETGLVRHATESVDADLAGDLGASMGLELDETGAEIFWGAFKDYREGQIPILIQYNLTYLARVSAEMSIHAKRQVIHRKLQQKSRPFILQAQPFLRYTPVAFTGVLNATALKQLRASKGKSIKAMIDRKQIRETIHKSITDNDIQVTIKTDEASSAEAGASIQEELFKLATEVLTDRVIPSLFGDESGQPGASSATQDNADMDLLEIQEGGAGDSEASFDMELTHQSTIVRSVNPNGPIQLFLDSPEAMQYSFRELRLTDGFFNLMNVTVSTTGVNFVSDGIVSIHVFLEYEQRDDANPAHPTIHRTMDQVLRSETDIIHWRFDMARQSSGGHKREYHYHTKVYYSEGPPRESKPRESSSRTLLITPRSMGALRVELVLTAASNVVQSAEVMLKHQAMNGTVYTSKKTLKPEKNKLTWFQYTGDLAMDDSDLNPPEYQYQFIYQTKTGNITMPWARSNTKTLEVGSPFKKIVTFTIRPQGSFDDVSHLSGNLVYNDSEHDYSISQDFQINALTDKFDFMVPLLADGPEEINWTARLNKTDGSAIDLGSGRAKVGTVWIGSEFNFLTVEVLADLIDFDTDVQLAIVKLTYKDPVDNSETSDTFTFKKGASDARNWKVGVKDPANTKYDASIRYITYDRSKSSNINLNQTDDQVLVLDRTE